MLREMDEEAGPHCCSGLQEGVWIRMCGGFLRKLGGKKKKAYVRLQRNVKGSGVCVCMCVFNKRKDSSMKEDVRNTIMLTHLSPASRSTSTVRGCYASATDTQGTRNAYR